MNICDVVLQRARQQPDSTAFVDGARAVSYRQLDRAIRGAAAGLSARGIAEGSLVAIEIPDVARHLIMTLAIAKLRAVSVAMPDLPMPAERVARLQALGVRHLTAVKPVPGMEALEFIAADPSLTRGQSPAVRAGFGPSADDVPWRIIWSSGSTGTPKPIVCTHRNRIAQMFVQQLVIPYGPGDAVFIGMSMQVMLGLMHGIRAFAFGAKVLGQPARMEQTFELCERHHVTHFVSTPVIAGRLASALTGDSPRLPSAQLYLGGGPVSPALRTTLRSRISPRIGNIYGTTETGMTALSDPRTFEAHPEAAGRVVPWLQVEAVDADDRPLPAGKPGRLRIRGIGTATGYLGEPAATAAAFRDGWFYPGDVGHVTADGFLVMQGRDVDVLNVGGQKTSPRAIEEVLEQHPDIAEAAAFVASGRDGQSWLAAVVVPRGDFDGPALRVWCRERLGATAPMMLAPVKSIPRSGMGKVLRGELARRFVVDPTAAARKPGAASGPGAADVSESGDV